MMNKILEYVQTAIITLFIAFLSVMGLLGIIQHNVYTQQQTKSLEKESIDYYLVGVLIEKNKYLEQQHPKNYEINLKLGMLYEVKGDFTNSEEEYYKAIKKAPYSETRPTYKLALLYLRLNKLNETQALVDNMKEHSNKSFIENKAEIYNRLGDKYYDKADYETAAWQYQKALFYYNTIKSKKIEFVKGNLASAYVYLAEEKVQKLQIDDAVLLLQKALGVIDAPILKYKLALLLVKSNPEKAYEYFQDVFQKEPNIINYQEYSSFLAERSENALLNGDIPKSKLYDHRIKKLKEYYKKNILSVNDLEIEDFSSNIRSNNWYKKYTIDVGFKVKNISKYNLNSLYIETIIKDANETIDSHFKQIADKNSPIKVNSQSPRVSLKATKKKTPLDSSPQKIIVQISAAKTPESYKILLKEFEVTEKTKRKK